MYTINISDYIKFVSSDFIPVKTDPAVVAAATSIDGSIQQLIIKNRGSSLTAGVYYAPIVGDGTSNAVARIVVDSAGANLNKISTVDVETIGAGYTFARVLLTEVYTTAAAALSRSGSSSSLGSTAFVEAIISPPGGHGSDPSLELGAYRVMVNKSLDFLDGDGDIPVDSQFRRFGLLSDPTTPSNVDLVSTTATACYAIKFPSSTTTNFAQGEVITQSSTGAKGRVIHWDSVTKVLRYYQNEYTTELQSAGDKLQYKHVPFSGQNAITGSISNTTLTPDTTANAAYFGINFVNGYASPEIKKNSGKVIYVENRKAVNRSNDQVEDIKLVIEF